MKSKADLFRICRIIMKILKISAIHPLLTQNLVLRAICKKREDLNKLGQVTYFYNEITYTEH